MRTTNNQNPMPNLHPHPHHQQIPQPATTPTPHRPQLPTHLQTTTPTMDPRPNNPMLDLRGIRHPRRPVDSRPPHTRRPHLHPVARTPQLQQSTGSRAPMEQTTMMHNHTRNMHTSCIKLSTGLSTDGGGWPNDGSEAHPDNPITRHPYASDRVVHRFFHRSGFSTGRVIHNKLNGFMHKSFTVYAWKVNDGYAT